jgi:phenylalanyl-tRNA synthetase beta subunit
MKVSYNNLQTYFAKPLPPVYELADLITTHVWEVDEIAQNGSDYILDLKVLPDRNYPGFGDKDVAWEVASILNWPAEGVPSPEMGNSIIFTTKQINNLLGLALSDQEILALLKRAHIEVESGGEGDYVAAPPGSRKDLHIVEDLADEVGRLYGVDKIPPQPLPPVAKPELEPLEKTMRYLRAKYLSEGYTEVYGYSLRPSGEVQVAKPLASDKGYLRTNLTEWLKERVQFNKTNLLFEKEIIKLFEIGKVFVGGQEEWHLAVVEGDKIEERKLEVIADAPEADLSNYIHWDVTFKPFSLQPRIIRDVAVWVAVGVSSGEVQEVIKAHAGELLAEGPVLFDEFKKGDKVSYAFRLAFQASDRTLEDKEVHEIMLKVVAELENKGWEVRK